MAHDLTNNLLRQQKLAELLGKMGLNSSNITPVFSNHLIRLDADDPQAAANLATNMAALLQESNSSPLQIQTLSMQELAKWGIQQSQSSNPSNKIACQGIFDNLTLNYSFTGHETFEVRFPSKEIGNLFATLSDSYIDSNGETLTFHLGKYLENHLDKLTLIDGKLFVPSNLLEQKQTFYIEEPLENGDLKVTPFIIIPKEIQSGTQKYIFILDTSGSMRGKHLDTLKTTVKGFAKVLFTFQPNATVVITEFNSKSKEIGQYRKEDLDDLNTAVERLKATGETHLFEVTAKQLNKLQSLSGHNNILLFTDGEDSTNNSEELEAAIKSLNQGSDLATIKNKFYIVSYGQKQPAILEDVTNLFNCPIILASSVDFIEALKGANEMQKWAAARDLFKYEYIVGDHLRTYKLPVDLSGHVQALEPRILNSANPEFTLRVFDSNGQTLISQKRLFSIPGANPVVQPVSNKVTNPATDLVEPILLSGSKSPVCEPSTLWHYLGLMKSKIDGTTDRVVDSMLQFARYVAKDNECYFPTNQVTPGGIYSTCNGPAFFQHANYLTIAPTPAPTSTLGLGSGS